ncbi:hypothetical protein ACGFNU_49110 [Spirillospora sp. NPDC048911]|uniref:hypothetical protein n=1 Tax=Spirillospora sp. NPDC048911 TaxID=3364527 RepID=UPI003715CBB8
MRAGLQLNERYRLVERLDDDGGAREVWRAWDDLLDRIIIVKVLDSIAPGLHRVFHRRMSRTAGLTHAGIATIYDFDHTRDADGCAVPYVVTEFLEGEDLATRLGRATLALPEALEMCARIAGTLAAAHANGVSHGDLRTSKAILAPGGIKLVDLGTPSAERLAKDFAASANDSAPSADDSTESSGDSVEEPADEAAEEPADEAVALADDTDGMRADIHAFGAVLNECLAAMAGASVPFEVTALASRCRASDPASRPSAAEAAQILVRAKAAAFDTITLTTPADILPPAGDPAIAGTPRLASIAAPAGVPRPGSGPGSRSASWSASRSAAASRATSIHDSVHAPADTGRVRREWGLGLTAILAIAATGAAIAVAASKPPPAAPLPQEQAATMPAPVRSTPAAPTTEPTTAPTTAPEPLPSITFRPGEADNVKALDMLDRLRPAVDRAFTQGEVRSDVAVDLGNVINNLRNDLLLGRQVDLAERLSQLQEKIVTRLREQALTPATADRLTRVLSTART